MEKSPWHQTQEAHQVGQQEADLHGVLDTAEQRKCPEKNLLKQLQNISGANSNNLKIASWKDLEGWGMIRLSGLIKEQF